MSASSEESFVDDFYNDPDYIYDAKSTLSDNIFIDDADKASSGETIDFVNFVDWDDVSLTSIAKRKTKSEIWNFYGTLKKGNTVFAPTAEKYFCKPCFDDHKFHR